MAAEASEATRGRPDWAGWLLTALIVAVSAAMLWWTVTDFHVLRSERVRNQTAAPPFSLVSFAGEPMTLEALRGRIVLLHFWASWCPSCRAEISVLRRVRKRHGSELVILGVGVMEPAEDARTFAKAQELPWPVASAEGAGVAERYGVDSVPRTILLDRQGIVQEQWRGAVSAQELVDSIESLRTSSHELRTSSRAETPP